MSNVDPLAILHTIPGRLRLTGEPLYGDAARASRIASAVQRIAGVREARANSLASSLVIEYDASLSLAEMLRRLSASAELAPFGFTCIERERRAPLRSGPSRGGSPRRTVEALLRTAGRVNDASTSIAPPHLDLKLIVPFSLFGYGLFRLLTSRHGPTPHWVVFLMYGFDMFAVLNQGTIRGFIEGARGAPRGGLQP